jgi:hypothetical protein
LEQPTNLLYLLKTNLNFNEVNKFSLNDCKKISRILISNGVINKKGEFNSKYIQIKDFKQYFLLKIDEKYMKYEFDDKKHISKDLEKKLDFLALKLLFSFKYDFSEIIDSNKSHIIKLINKYKEKFSKYLYSLEFQNNNIKIESKLIMKLSNLLINSNVSLEDNLSKKVDKINFQKLCLVCWNKESYNKFLIRKKAFTIKYLKYLLLNWNKSLDDYSEIVNQIKDDIPCYCQYFIKTILSKEYKIKTINFFFDEFIYLFIY